MTQEETERYALFATIRHSTRMSWEDKIGKAQYSLTRYERLIRATVPLMEGHLLLLTFDIDCLDVDRIILTKVMQGIKNYHR